MNFGFLILAPLIIAILIFVIVSNTLYPGALNRWIARKNYQYEVSIGAYMLTPTERFILNSFFFLSLSMLLIAASLYLPEHIVTMSRRAFYYYSGSSSSSSLSGSTAPFMDGTTAAAVKAVEAGVAGIQDARVGTQV